MKQPKDELPIGDSWRFLRLLISDQWKTLKNLGLLDKAQAAVRKDEETVKLFNDFRKRKRKQFLRLTNPWWEYPAIAVRPEKISSISETFHQDEDGNDVVGSCFIVEGREYCVTTKAEDLLRMIEDGKTEGE